MPKYLKSPLWGIAAVCLLTAADSGCPTCVELTCSLESGSILVSGPALSTRPAEAVLVIEDATSSCELPVDPSLITEAPGDDWSLSVPYPNAECGTELSGQVLEAGEAGERSPIGVCS